MVSSSNTLQRLVIVSEKAASQLPNAAIIPLYFTVISNGQTETTTLTVNLSSSQVVGVLDTPDGQASSIIFSLEGESTPLTFSVAIADLRAASVTNLTCSSSCGQNIILKWTDSPNEDGYKISKDGTPLAIIGKNATAYPYNWCNNFENHTYAVIAFNAANGSVSTSGPTVDCACAICPTPEPPTPTPMLPTNSADLIFRAIFSDADPTVNDIPNVKITITDDAGNQVCDDGNNCEKVVTFHRIPDAKVNNTFKSPQLQYSLQKTRRIQL